jgi:F-type H+-transporting ATPase subunit epsilon
MSEPILLEVLTAERRVLSAKVSELQFLTADRGYYGILPCHTPLVTPLGDGLLTYTQKNEKHVLTVFGGFAEVGADRVTILAGQSETPEGLDASQVHQDQQRALQALREAQSPEEQEAARKDLTMAEVRLQAIGA